MEAEVHQFFLFRGILESLHDFFFLTRLRLCSHIVHFKAVVGGQNLIKFGISILIIIFTISYLQAAIRIPFSFIL